MAASASSSSAAALPGNGRMTPLEEIRDVVDFGPVAGSLRIRQLTAASWNERCKTESTKAGGDFTGQRIYLGSHILIRFFYRYPWLIDKKTIVELGCGVGACGILAARLAHHVILTDGEEQTLEMTRANVHDAGLENVTVCKSLWEDEGDMKRLQKLLLAKETTKLGVPDVILGADLMYFNIDVHALLQTAASLFKPPPSSKEGNKDEDEDSCDNGGVILLAHIFRTTDLPQALLQCCQALDYNVYRLSLQEVLLKEDLESLASWSNVSLLLIIKKEHPQTSIILEKLPAKGIRPFVPYQDDEGEEEQEDGLEETWSSLRSCEG